MADYYPLLAKAVAGLNDPTPEARQAIYNRARGALLNQLRSIKPPVPERDIERESTALDEAVRRLEFEAGASPAARPADPPQRPSPPRVGAQRGTPGVRAPAAAVKRRKIDASHPAAPQAPREKPSGARFWIVSLTIVIVVGIIGVTAYLLRDRPDDVARVKPAAGQAATEAASSAKLQARADTSTAAPSTPAAAPPAPHPAAAPPPVAAEPSAPIRPIPVATVPITLPPAPPPTSGTAPADAGSPSAAAAKPATAPAPVAAAPAPAAPGPVAGIPAAGPPAAPSSTSAPPATPAVAAPTPADPTTPAIPIAYRAALLVESPDDPKEHIKTYVGTVVWRLDNVNSDEGQPLSVAVHADIDLPDAKMKVSMTMKKNTDAAFEASHTMVLGFTFAPGSEYTGVKEIKLPRLRNEESADGDALVGVGVVPIMENYFLVGLSPGDANVTHNLDLIRSRGWIDVPLQLSNGRVAKITFEKGVQGDRTISDALAAWK
jgi:hypothetical protein